jgi:single-strand DNA-binding protein
MKNLEAKVNLIGHLEAMPEVIEFKNGRKITHFIITSVQVQKQNGKLIKSTQWYNIVACNKNADIAKQNLSVGTEVLIEGRLINKKYQDSNQNVRIISEVLAESILFREIKFAISASKNSENIA